MAPSITAASRRTDIAAGRAANVSSKLNLEVSHVIFLFLASLTFSPSPTTQRSGRELVLAARWQVAGHGFAAFSLWRFRMQRLRDPLTSGRSLPPETSQVQCSFLTLTPRLSLQDGRALGAEGPSHVFGGPHPGRLGLQPLLSATKTSAGPQGSPARGAETGVASRAGPFLPTCTHGLQLDLNPRPHEAQSPDPSIPSLFPRLLRVDLSPGKWAKHAERWPSVGGPFGNIHGSERKTGLWPRRGCGAIPVRAHAQGAGSIPGGRCRRQPIYVSRPHQWFSPSPSPFFFL